MAITKYERQVKTQAAVAPQLTLPKDTAGQSIAAGLDSFGRGIGAYGLKLRDEADKVVISEAFSEYKKGMQNGLYGEGGWLSRQGKDAMDLVPTFDQDADALKENVTKNMSARQVALFNEKAGAYELAARATVFNHQHTQLKAHELSEATGAAQTSLEAAVANYASPELFKLNVQDFNEALGRMADLKGLQGEARTAFIDENRSKLTIGGVNKILQDNPDNPRKALTFMQDAKKLGYLRASDETMVMKSIRPAMDAADVRSLASEWQKRAIARNAELNKDNDGEPKYATSEMSLEILNDKTIPEHLRLSVAQAFTRGMAVVKAAEDEAYANLYSSVEEKLLAGVPPGEIPDYFKLRTKDQQQLQWGARKDSDRETVVNFMDHPEQLTVAAVDAERGKLSKADYLHWRGQAERFQNSRDKGAQEIAKAVNKARVENESLEYAFILMGRESEIKKNGFKKTSEWLAARSYASMLVQEWMVKNKTTELPPLPEMQSISVRALRRVTQEENWGIDDPRTLSDVAFMEQKDAVNGTPPSFQLSSLILRGRNDEEIENSAVVRDRLAAQLKAKGIEPTAHNVSALWINILTTNPEKAQQIVEEAKKGK